jgi:NAD+ synthase
MNATETGPAADPLALNAPLVERVLVGFLRNEVRRVGFERVVVGLSGGIDSTVSAYLAARALGAENVCGVRMPYTTSSPETMDHAALVARELGIRMLTLPISAQIDAYFSQFPDASRLRRANKMARERMTILYDQSAAQGALVLGTSNKTELLLGYGTIFGDMASALNPIGDLYKTQVWALAAHLGVPEPIIRKNPTADLWAGQTDEAELGFTYAEVDRLLVRMVDLRARPDELVAAGIDPAFIAKIARMVQTSHYKRRLPVIAKLSHRTIDRDFRYARDWGT